MTCSCAEKVILTFQSWEVNKYISRNPDLAAIFSHRCRNSTFFRDIQQPYCCAPPTEEPKQIEKITDRVYCLCHRQLISRLGLGNSQGVDGDVRYFNRKCQGEREGLSSSKLHRPGKGLKTNLKYWCVLSFPSSFWHLLPVFIAQTCTNRDLACLIDGAGVDYVILSQHQPNIVRMPYGDSKSSACSLGTLPKLCCFFCKYYFASNLKKKNNHHIYVVSAEQVDQAACQTCHGKHERRVRTWLQNPALSSSSLRRLAKIHTPLVAETQAHLIVYFFKMLWVFQFPYTGWSEGYHSA